MTQSDDYFVTTVVRRPTLTTARPRRGASVPLIVGVVLVLVPVALAAFAVLHRPASRAGTPETLAPRAASRGIPSSLGDAVRIQAEANRHAALQTVQQVGSADLTQLAATQSTFRWVGGGDASDGPTVVSVAGHQTATIVAVSASNHDVCAFGRWSEVTRPEYVTMVHLPACRAIDAPTTGWSTLAGGSGSDLPDETG